jgi:plasmid stabilization system protein ParE
MGEAFWTHIAQSELEEILRYIREEAQRPETAQRLATEIREAVENHAKRFLPGGSHPALPPGWLYLKYKRWLIAYVRLQGDVIVQRIVDASRDLPSQFAD